MCNIFPEATVKPVKVWKSSLTWHTSSVALTPIKLLFILISKDWLSLFLFSFHYLSLFFFSNSVSLFFVIFSTFIYFLIFTPWGVFTSFLFSLSFYLTLTFSQSHTFSFTLCHPHTLSLSLFRMSVYLVDGENTWSGRSGSIGARIAGQKQSLRLRPDIQKLKI